MNSWGVYVAFPLVLICVWLQSTLVSYFTLLGTTLQLVPLFVLAWAMWRGTGEAVLLAFLAGLSLDLLSTGPLGLTSFALMVSVLALLPFRPNLPLSRFLFPILLSGAGIFIFSLVSLLIIRVTGYPNDAGWWQRLPQTVLLHAFVTPIAYWSLQAIGRLLGIRPRVSL